jgi:hypothetical protein
MRSWVGYRAIGAASHLPPITPAPLTGVLEDTGMSEMFAPPKVTIRRYAASRICDVEVVVRGQKMVIRCPSYSHALKWARLECKSYKIPEPNFPDDEPGDMPLFLRTDGN